MRGEREELRQWSAPQVVVLGRVARANNDLAGGDYLDGYNCAEVLGYS